MINSIPLAIESRARLWDRHVWFVVEVMVMACFYLARFGSSTPLNAFPTISRAFSTSRPQCLFQGERPLYHGRATTISPPSSGRSQPLCTFQASTLPTRQLALNPKTPSLNSRSRVLLPRRRRFDRNPFPPLLRARPIEHIPRRFFLASKGKGVCGCGCCCCCFDGSLRSDAE